MSGYKGNRSYHLKHLNAREITKLFDIINNILILLGITNQDYKLNKGVYIFCEAIHVTETESENEHV